MAVAVLVTGVLRATLPPQLRAGDARWLFFTILVVLVVALVMGDPERIDRDSVWLRVVTGTLIGFISIANAASVVKLVIGILATVPFTDNAKILMASGGAIWLTNVIGFGLLYWDVDRGGAVARARGSTDHAAFLFPEMTNSQFVDAGWYPKFVDYLSLSFATAMAFSPTDVSAIRPWAKVMMMSEDLISLVVAVLVISRAINILK